MKANVTGLKNVNFENNSDEFEKEGGFIDTMSRFTTKRDGISLGAKPIREITPLRLITNENKDL